MTPMFVLSSQPADVVVGVAAVEGLDELGLGGLRHLEEGELDASPRGSPVFVGVSSVMTSGLTAFVYCRSLMICTAVSCHHMSWSFWTSTLGFGGTGNFSLSMALSP